MHDCCPFQQPLQGQQHATTAIEFAAVAQMCCVAGAADMATMGAAAEKHEVRKPELRPDPLPGVASLYLAGAVFTLPPQGLRRAPAAYFPSYSTLYLSSGRLRL